MCDKCDWEEYLDKIDDALESGEYDFEVEEFLGSVYGWVKENEHITEKQRDAIDNILGG